MMKRFALALVGAPLAVALFAMSTMAADPLESPLPTPLPRVTRAPEPTSTAPSIEPVPPTAPPNAGPSAQDSTAAECDDCLTAVIVLCDGSVVTMSVRSVEVGR